MTQRASCIIEGPTEEILQPQLSVIQTQMSELAMKSGVTAVFSRWNDLTPVPPTPPPVRKVSLGGVHIMGGNHAYYYPDYLQRLADAGKPVGVIKAMEDGGLLEAKTVSKDTVTIWRNSIGGDDFPSINWRFTSSAQCKASALDWLNRCYPIWGANPADYYEIINEPNPTTQEDVAWMIEWLVDALVDANPRGFKLGMGGFSAGTPEYWQMQQMLDFADMCALTGNILCLHDWAIKSMYPDASLRYRKWKAMSDAAGKKFPLVVLTEVYNYMPIDQTYWDNWKWYLTEMQKDDYCLGACWFTIGDFGGVNFEGEPLKQYTELQLSMITESPIPPTPEPTPTPTPTPIPSATTLSGVGMGNARPLTLEEMQAVQISKVTAFKALTVQDHSECTLLADQIIHGIRPSFVMARLMFPPDAENKTRFTPQMFVDYCGNPALDFYSAGIRYFEIHNEPNLYSEGAFWNWMSGAEFAEWFNETCLILRKLMPNALLGYPGLSPQIDDVPNACIASDKFLQDSRSAVISADWLGTHSYWQSRGTGHWQMSSEDFGGWYYRRAQRAFPSKTFFITEYSCNNPAVSDSDKGLMYRDYLKDLPNIRAAFAFCLSWGYDQNNEAWVRNGAVTQIPISLGS